MNEVLYLVLFIWFFKSWKFRLELFAYCWSLCHTIFDVVKNVNLDTQHNVRWGSELQTMYSIAQLFTVHFSWGYLFEITVQACDI